MVVVDGVEHVVLNVPAEAGEHHADVHPGHHHARDVFLNVAKHRAICAVQLWQIVQVPAVLSIRAVT